MTRDEYAQLVDYLTDRFGIGRMDAWSKAAVVYPDFERLDSEAVWAAMLAKLDANAKAEWPPTPPALRAAALDRIRHTSRPPALPPSSGGPSWAEVSQRLFGEVISPGEAAERRAREFAEQRRSRDV